MSFDTEQPESKLMHRLMSGQQPLLQVENLRQQPSLVGMGFPKGFQLKRSETVIYGSFKQSRGDKDPLLELQLHPSQIVFVHGRDLLRHISSVVQVVTSNG